jgi:Putative glycolipid-binding
MSAKGARAERLEYRDEGACSTSSSNNRAATHAVSWVRYEDQGAEYAQLSLGRTRLSASSTAVGTRPLPYLADLVLQTGDDFITSKLAVTTRGLGWKRSIELRPSEEGVWTTRVAQEGEVDLGDPGSATPTAGQGPQQPSSASRSTPTRRSLGTRKLPTVVLERRSAWA